MIALLAKRYGPEGWPVATVKAEPPEGFDGYIKRLDNLKSREILGIQYRPLIETVNDMAARMIELGVVSKPKILSPI